MTAAERWAEAYERAWRAGDGEAAAALYAEDCVFRSHPFRELEDARAYMRRVVPEAEAPEVWFGEPVEDGDRAAIEWWALLVEPNGEKSTIAGCHVVRFGDEGLARARDCACSGASAVLQSKRGAVVPSCRDRQRLDVPNPRFPEI